jgi:hypothetical protein
MKLESIVKATDGIHKLKATFVDDDGRKKTTLFGLKGALDYLLTGDEDRRDRYRQRHAKDLDTNDPTRAGYLSYYVLWNLPTLKASIADYRKRFDL